MGDIVEDTRYALDVLSRGASVSAIKARISSMRMIGEGYGYLAVDVRLVKGDAVMLDLELALAVVDRAEWPTDFSQRDSLRNLSFSANRLPEKIDQPDHYGEYTPLPMNGWILSHLITSATVDALLVILEPTAINVIAHHHALAELNGGATVAAIKPRVGSITLAGEGYGYLAVDLRIVRDDATLHTFERALAALHRAEWGPDDSQRLSLGHCSFRADGLAETIDQPPWYGEYTRLPMNGWVLSHLVTGATIDALADLLEPSAMKFLEAKLK